MTSSQPSALVVVTAALFMLVYCDHKQPPSPAPVPSATAPAVAEPMPSTDPEPPAEPEAKVLAQFSTKFKAGPKFKGREANIELLAKKLSDTVLKPGEEFSFNAAAGPRTIEAGFKQAPTYFLGEILEGIGGGTCQVSSTMYAAALHVNVDIVDRRPHSRVSSYIPAGLDATVNYPPECWDTDKPDLRVCYDLKFKNPYKFPLIFRFETSAEIEKEKPTDENGQRTLTCTVFGTGPADKVETAWKAFGAPPFDTRYRRVSWWQNNRKRLKQSGKPGLRGARVLTVTHPDGKVEKKTIYSEYSPVPEVFEVGMQFERPPEETDDQPNSEQ